jgi:biotin operon repressor
MKGNFKPMPSVAQQQSSAYATRNSVSRTIRSRILSGEIAPGQKLESVRDLARKLKHGQATVVRAIETLVQEGYLVTQDRKGTYVAQRSAWQPVPRNIAVLTGVPTGFSASALADMPYLAGISVLQEAMVRGGDRVSLHGCVFYPCGPVIRRYTPPRNLALDSMDAIVAAGIYELPYLASLLELGIPVIAYDVDASSVRMDSVFVDDVDSAFALTNVLLDQGHRSVAYLGGPLNAPRREQLWNYDPCAVTRADGYRLAMRQRGLPEKAFHCDWTTEKRAQTIQVLEQMPDCTAIVCSGPVDEQVLDEREIARATWTNERPGAWPERLVAVAHCDQQEMGAAAGDVLRFRLDNPDAPIQRRPIRAHVLVRESH